MRMKNSKRAKSKEVSFGADLYRANAKQLLGDLTELLRLLGISAKFKISSVKNSSVSDRTKGHQIAYAFAIGEILSHWHQDTAYLDHTGKPRALTMSGEGATFTQLVTRASLNTPASEALEALRRAGAIEMLDNGMIRPVRRTLTVFADHDLAIHHTFIALKGILSTLHHNLKSKPLNVEQLFHRIAWIGNQTASDVARLRVWLNKHGQGFLESTDDWMKLRRTPLKKTKRRFRVSVGTYLSVEND